MQTVLWLLNFIAGLGCSSFSLYFYLSHDDLDKGMIEPFDLADQMSKFIPYEIYLHAFISFVCLFNGNFLLFMYNLPLLAFHLKMLVNREHVFHIITIGEYKDKEKNKKFIKVKLAFYLVLLILIMLRFMYAFSNMIIYNIFGKTYKNKNLIEFELHFIIIWTNVLFMRQKTDNIVQRKIQHLSIEYSISQ